MKELAISISSLFNLDNQVTMLSLVFLTTVLMFLAIVSWLMGGNNPVQRRLRAIEHPEEVHVSQHEVEGNFYVRIVKSAADLVVPDPGWMDSALRSRLVRAGYYSPQALRLFIGNKVLLGIVVPSLIVVIALFAGYTPAAGNLYVILLIVLAALLGYHIPSLILVRRISKRRLDFSESFPDAMDMFVVCVEAGLGLDAAIHRVGEELRYSHPVLASEFAVLSLELRSGKSREEALRGLADRIGLNEVNELVTLLIQADHFGTSIAEALRVHANEMRTLRIQKARERAAKLPVKLIFPIIVLIFPALFLVVLGPAMVRIYESFLGTFSGG